MHTCGYSITASSTASSKQVPACLATTDSEDYFENVGRKERTTEGSSLEMERRGSLSCQTD